MNTNELSFRELADVLAELGIAEVSQERIEELENVWEKCPEEVLDSLNKMAMLLTEVGHGNYDYTTWTWTPSSNKVYSFDMEAFDVSSMYVDSNYRKQGLGTTNAECVGYGKANVSENGIYKYAERNDFENIKKIV